MLADPRGLQRALRPLKRRVPSPRRRELDEDATAARIADSGLWAPVLVPAPERWLTLDLVVDTGPTMRLWRPLARELAETLVRQGAFRNVHVSYLHGGRVSGGPGAPPRAPGTLLHPSGRHAVLVLSDCSGPHWWDGRAARAVRRWARTGPTAILQPLSERMWRRTAAPTTPGTAHPPRPGAPNTDLRFVPYDGDAAGVPVPVLEVAPRWFAAWADLVAGAGPRPVAVALPQPSRPSGPAPVERERDLPVDERVRRFLATASPTAAELAAHVAVSVPSLPVMRLIQHRVLGGAGPGQLAEVLLSGLLRPVDDLHYAFVPGAREALLDTLPRPEAQHTRHVLEAVSAEIERRAGTGAEVFRALVPSSGGRVRLVADTGHFAVVSPRTRASLPPAPSVPPVPPAPSVGRAPLDYSELLGAPPEDLIGGERPDLWDPVPFGEQDGGPLIGLDLLAERDGHHLAIIGPRTLRDRWLRTLVVSLVLHHPPSKVEFAFVDCSGGASFTGLGALPHVAAAVHATSLDSALLDGFESVLDAELARREDILREAGARTWLDYRADIVLGSSRPRLPALVVVLDDTDPLFEHRPALRDFLANRIDRALAAGVRLVLCASARPALGSLDDMAVLAPATGEEDDGYATLYRPSVGLSVRIRPGVVSPDALAPLVEALAAADPPARPLPWPSGNTSAPRSDDQHGTAPVEGATPDGNSVQEQDVPAVAPAPFIGFDDHGNAVWPYRLGRAGDVGHGVIVGDTGSRQRMVRVLTSALADLHSPDRVSFVFGGLGEHPLGAPPTVPNVARSEEELLGYPDRLHGLLGFLAEELDYRAGRSAPEAPFLVVVVDVSLTLPPSRPELADMLLRIAQRGKPLGIALVLASTTVDGSTAWNRLLQLLDWRIVTGPLEPAVLRRVLKRPGLPFDRDRTAYLQIRETSARRFTIAPEPVADTDPSASGNADHPPNRDTHSPQVARLTEHARATGARIALGVDGETGGTVELNFGTDPHLVVCGPAGSGKRTFVRRLVKELTRREEGRQTLVYVLDGQMRDVMPGARYARTGDEFASLLVEARSAIEVQRMRARRPPNVYLVVLNRKHLIEADPLAALPTLGAEWTNGIHAILAKNRLMLGQPPDPFVERMRETGGAVLFLGECDGREADLWDVEAPLRGPLAHGDAVLARPDGRRRVRLAEHLGVGPDSDAGDLPAVVHADELPMPTDGRVPIGVWNHAHDPVLLDFNADPHLVVVGGPGTGLSNLVRLISTGLAAGNGAEERAVYVFDPVGLLKQLAADAGFDGPVAPGVRYTDTSDGLARFATAATARAAETECFFIITGSAGPQDTEAVLGMRRAFASRRTGLHLVLALGDDRSGGAAFPVVLALHEMGAPAILLGRCNGAVAELYGAPVESEDAPPGRGVLIRDERHIPFLVAEVSPPT